MDLICLQKFFVNLKKKYLYLQQWLKFRTINTTWFCVMFYKRKKNQPKIKDTGIWKNNIKFSNGKIMKWTTEISQFCSGVAIVFTAENLPYAYTHVRAQPVCKK
jgi:hypothetical protein